MSIGIRNTTADDLPTISALLAETWHATYDGIYGETRVAEITGRWHAADKLALGLNRDDTSFLIAEDGGRIVGTVALVRGADGTLDLKRLYVLPDVQGQGVGDRLFDAALAAFPGAMTVRLEVEPANAQAIGYYERRGFTAAGKTNDCSGSGDNIPALVMSLRLDRPETGV